MKSSLSVDEYDLLAFFEAMPTPLEHDISWLYNDSAYEVMRGHVHLTFALLPVSRDLRIKLKIGGVLVYELNAGYIQDIKHHVEKGLESLEVILAPNDSLWIRLKPEVSVYHTMMGR